MANELTKKQREKILQEIGRLVVLFESINNSMRTSIRFLIFPNRSNEDFAISHILEDGIGTKGLKLRLKGVFQERFPKDLKSFELLELLLRKYETLVSIRNTLIHSTASFVVPPEGAEEKMSFDFIQLRSKKLTEKGVKSTFHEIDLQSLETFNNNVSQLRRAFGLVTVLCEESDFKEEVLEKHLTKDYVESIKIELPSKNSPLWRMRK